MMKYQGRGFKWKNTFLVNRDIQRILEVWEFADYEGWTSMQMQLAGLGS